jgi:hypothetical protein
MSAPSPQLRVLIAALLFLPASLSAAPEVLFCKGECFWVDEQGILRALRKGIRLPENARLETGPDSYAQLRIAPDVDIAVGDRARVRLDGTTFKDRRVVILDRGRIRIISGEAAGKAAEHRLELRTVDGIFPVNNADIEAKKLATAGGTPGLTYMKLNAGDAQLRTSRGDVVIGKQAVQGIAAGKVIADQSFSLAEVAVRPPKPGKAEQAAAPVSGAERVSVVNETKQIPGIATSYAASSVESVDTLNRTTGLVAGTSPPVLPAEAKTALGAGVVRPVIPPSEVTLSTGVVNPATGKAAPLHQVYTANQMTGTTQLNYGLPSNTSLVNFGIGTATAHVQAQVPPKRLDIGK